MKQLKTLLRPAMIFIPFTLGILLPQAHILGWTIRWALVVMLFLVCLQLKFKQMKPQPCHWYLLIANLLFGIVPYFAIRSFGPEYQQLAQAAFFVGITPTANAAPVVMGFLHGRVGFVLTGFVLTNLFISLSLLGLIPMVTGRFTFEFASHVGQNLLVIMGLPLTAAVVVRYFFPKAKEFPKKCKTFSFSLWSFTLFVIAAIASEHFRRNPNESLLLILEIAAVSLVICAGNFLTGALIAPKWYKRESSQTLGQKNTTLTMYLALTYVNPLVAMGPIFYVLWHNSWNAWQMFRFDRRSGKKMEKMEKLRLLQESSGPRP